MTDRATAYIRKIRNPSKRSYAEDVLRAMRQGKPEPDRPTNLSYMAAQAVRLELTDCLKPKTGIGSDVCWRSVLGDYLTGTIIGDEGSEWLIRRTIGGTCTVPKFLV